MNDQTLAIRSSRAGLIALLPLLLLILTGCEDVGMVDLAVEMGSVWAETNGLIYEKANGDLGVNYGKIIAYEAASAWDPKARNARMDAVVEAGTVVMPIRTADGLAEAGMNARDPAQLDQAIALRPQDWSYRDQKAAVLAANGDPAGANDEIAASEGLVAERIAAGGSCRGLKQNMLRNRENALSRQLEADPENETLMTLLMDTQDQLYLLQNNLPGSPCP